MSEEEQKLFRLYGKLPTHKNVLTKMQKVHVIATSLWIICLTYRHVVKDRKYFDSGDYALSKAGVAPQNAVGTAIPNPEKYVILCVQACNMTLIRNVIASPMLHLRQPIAATRAFRSPLPTVAWPLSRRALWLTSKVT